MVLATAPNAWASAQLTQVNKGNDLYHKGRYDASAEAYGRALKSDPQSPLIQYDLGTALYKNKDYAGAIEHLKQSLNTKEPSLQNKTQYNLGGALYKHGLELEHEDLQGAIHNLEEALGHYQQVLSRDTKNQDAQYNKAIVAKELKRLKKRQEKERQKQKDQQGKDGQQGQPQDQNQELEQKQEQGQKQQQSQQGQKQGADQKQGRQPDQPDGQKDVQQKEAQMFLEDYERNEEPKGLLNFVPKSAQEKSVEKDW